MADTGKGIPADSLKLLFEPFNRLNAENSNIEGTGIGLTITKRIIDLMGGEISVDSEVGVGTTFCIDLPSKSMAETQDPSLPDPQSDVAATAHPVHQYQILYIEDSQSNIKLIRRALAKKPHIKLITAEHPEFGIQVARQEKPDLLLLDINLPEMDGYQVLEIVRQTAELQELPIFAITANAMPEDIERGTQAGFNEYLTKPLNIKYLHELLDQYLHTD